MKVLIVNTHYLDNVGGSEIQCHIIAKYLSDFGHDVTYGIIKPEKSEYPVCYHYELIGGGFLNSYRNLIKHIKPDIIYWRFNKRHLLTSSFITRMNKSKFVFAVSSIPDTERWIWSGTAKKQYRFVIDRRKNTLENIKDLTKIIYNIVLSGWNYFGFYLADAIVYNNEDLYGKLPSKNQYLIHNSIIPNTEEFSWPNPYVVWVSNIKDKKNPEEYIKLANALENRDIDFLMIGKIVQSKYDYLNFAHLLPKKLKYLGPKSPTEINGIIKSSLFLVHTCEPEGFPNVFIQAWTNGKPTISMFYDPETVINKLDIGFISGSMENLILHTSELLDNKELRTQMGNNARDYSLKEFDPILNIRKLEKFFDFLIHR